MSTATTTPTPTATKEPRKRKPPVRLMTVLNRDDSGVTLRIKVDKSINLYRIERLAGAAEGVVAVALVLLAYRRHRTVHVDELDKLAG